jgi:hypothetical protein
MLASKSKSTYQVINVENVPHLLTVAGDSDGAALDYRDDEVSEPALILDAELPGAIDAGHTKYYRPQTVDASVVSDILIRCPLGAAVGRVKVQRSRLVDALRKLPVLVAGLLLNHHHVSPPGR